MGSAGSSRTVLSLVWEAAWAIARRSQSPRSKGVSTSRRKLDETKAGSSESALESGWRMRLRPCPKSEGLSTGVGRPPSCESGRRAGRDVGVAILASLSGYSNPSSEMSEASNECSRLCCSWLGWKRLRYGPSLRERGFAFRRAPPSAARQSSSSISSV